MFSAGLLRYELDGDRLLPSYLDARYTELARCLLLHYEAFAGRPYRELVRALEELSEPNRYESRVVAGLRRVVEESVRLAVEVPVSPRRIREAVYELAAKEPELRPKAIYREVAGDLGVAPETLEESLFADLRLERLVRFRRSLPTPAELISRYNFRLLQGFYLHALKVQVTTGGLVRSVYRFAKLNGLIVEVKRSTAEATVLEISGPLALFQKTRKYGYALSRFLPACCTAGSYRVEAEILLHRRTLRLAVTQADRVLSSHRPPRDFDSKLERRFCGDFVRLGSPWEIVREAELIPVGATVFLPDFTFRLRERPEMRVDLEIIGFWTRDYLTRKRALLRLFPRRRIIFCVDRRLCCDPEPFEFPCVWFAGRIPAGEVLAALEKFVAAGGRWVNSR